MDKLEEALNEYHWKTKTTKEQNVKKAVERFQQIQAMKGAYLTIWFKGRELLVVSLDEKKLVLRKVKNGSKDLPCPNTDPCFEHMCLMISRVPIKVKE